MPKAEHSARVNLRLPLAVKQQIEEAATIAGQSVNEFAVAELAKAAHRVLHEQPVTQLSLPDYQRFLALLDRQDVIPNRALTTAAKRYQKQFRQR